MIKTVLFDLDGTLLDTLDDLTVAVNVALEEKGFSLRTRAEIQSFVGNGFKKLLERAVPAKTEESVILECLNRFSEYYTNHLMVKTKPYDGVIKALEDLKKEGYQIGVVSNKRDDAAKTVCDFYFGNCLDCVVGESDTVKRKPYPDTVQFALETLNTKLEDAILLGDSTVDYETSKNAKIRFLAVTWGFRTKEELQNAGVTEFIESTDQIVSAIVQKDKG
ncbi:MAG: HAD family hydrolase [Clostridia bacterium]|nr:HAD family hydrolase [Clostridia bacterium]